MRALILDDEAPAREGMRKLLLAHPDVQVVGEAARVEAALKLTELRQPDLVFVDVQLRGESGFEYIAQAPAPLPQVIFVTAYDRYAAEAFRVNAVDYLLKPVEPERLAEALQRVRERLRVASAAGWVRPAVAHPAALRTLGLTTREAEVLYWIAQGKTNAEIAEILTNSPETVKKQVQRVLDRLGVDSRVQAALTAAKILGLNKE